MIVKMSESGMTHFTKNLKQIRIFFTFYSLTVFSFNMT